MIWRETKNTSSSREVRVKIERGILNPLFSAEGPAGYSYKHSNNPKNRTGFKSKTTALHVNMLLSKLLWLPLHDYDLKPPKAKFYGEREQTRKNFPSLHNRRFISQARQTRNFAWTAKRVRSARRGEEKNKALVTSPLFWLFPRSLHERCVPVVSRSTHEWPRVITCKSSPKYNFSIITWWHNNYFTLSN